MKIKRSEIIYTFLFMVVTIIGNVFSFLLDKRPLNALSLLGVCCLLELCLFLILSSLISKSFFSFSTIFIVVLFVFNFGQVVIYTFFRGVYPHVRFLVLMSPQEALNGYRMIYLVFSAICLGVLIYLFIDKKKVSKVGFRNTIEKRRNYNLKYNWIKVAQTTICLTFPIKIFIDVMCLYVSLTQGGPAARAWVNEFPNVLLYLGKISLVGFSLMIVALKDQRKKQREVFFFIELYILIMMVSGIRSENVGYLLILLLVYLSSASRKVKVSTMLFYTVLGFFVLTFIMAAGYFRGVEEKSFSSFINVFKVSLTEKNIIFTLLDNMGDTGYTAVCVINKWLPTYGPSYGKSYVLGSFAVIPNIPYVSDLPGQLTKESFFALKLQDFNMLYDGYLNIGGSLIGEMLFNFGFFGATIVASLFGFGIAFVSVNTKRAIDYGFVGQLIVFIPIMYVLIYWVRDYYGGGIREVVWGILFILVILKFVPYVKSKNNRFKKWG